MTIAAANDTLTYKGATGQTEQAVGVQLLGRAAERVEGPHEQIAFRSLASANPLVLHAGECRLLASALGNVGTGAFLKFYDKATAPSEADTPVLTVALAASTFQGQVQDYLAGRGIHFTNGCAIRITGAVADNDTTTIAAGQVTGFFALVS